VRVVLKKESAAERHKGFCAFCAFLWLIPFLALAQQPQETIALTDFPVPAWPEEGAPTPKDKYVFVDLAKNEYVVAYPGNLGTPAFEKEGPAPLKTARYELLRNVDPVVQVEVTRPSSTKYRYAYNVMNGPAAKQSIDQWLLVVPLQAGNDSIKHPAGWFGVIQRGRTFKLKNPEWIRNGAAAVWSFEKDVEVIPPGATKKGFELESELKPGFTIGYFRKAASVAAVVATSGNVPKAVKDQLDPLLSVEYNSRTVLTIGPKFDRAVDDRTVALDFIEAIGFLSRSGELDSNSEFVKNTLSELKGIPPGASGSAVKLTSQARTPVETEILNALKTVFPIN
jgi:hypothetical protein